MIVGDTSNFAIESGITQAYERLSFRALGYFVIHIGGRRYGVYTPDATMLACSFDEVQRRLAERSSHTAPFANSPNAGKIADAFRKAVFAPGQEKEFFFGIQQPEFCNVLNSNRIVWAPDGDEAFDDGSFVLQFDVGTLVRLIAFKSCEDGYDHDPITIRDLWLNANDFYHTLERWRNGFEAAWASAPKMADNT
jgi:hypothetical protein